MTPLLARASLRRLARHRTQLLLSVLGVALGVAVVVGIDLANASASRAFTLSVEAVAGRATHRLVGGPAGLDERVYTQLRTAYDLREAAPVIEGWVGVPTPDGGERTVRLFGIDPFAEAEVRDFTQDLDVDGDADLVGFLTRPDTAVLGTELAAILGVETGDRLTLSTGASLEIISLLAPAAERDRRALDNLLIVDISTAQERLDRLGRLDRIDLVLDTEQARALADALAADLPTGVQLQRTSTRSGALDEMTRAFRLNLTALSLLALLVGAFLIYNTMTFSVVQRRALIGVERALGVTRREITTGVLLEAAAIGIAGTVLGWGFGLLLAEALLDLVTQTINDLYFAVAVDRVQIGPWAPVKALLLGIGATLAAAWIPAREATSIPPRLATQRSGLERKAREGVKKSLVVGCGLIVVASVLLLIPSRSIAFSFAVVFLFIVGFAALVPPATVAAVQLLQPVARRLVGILGAMAARGVAATLSRTGIAMAALVIAVAVTVGVGIMVISFRSTLVDWLDVTLQADVYVAPAFERSRSGNLDPAVIARLAAHPDVESVTTYRRVDVNDADGNLVLLTALGIKAEHLGIYDLRGSSPAEAHERLREGAIVVSEPFAFHYRVGPGDTVQLQTDRGLVTFPIVAVYEDFGSDRGVVTMLRDVYDQHFDDDAIHSLGLWARPDVDADQLASDLQASTPEGERVSYVSNRGLREVSLTIFDRTFVITGVLQLLSVVIAFVGILSALMALQLERGRELAVMRANGLTPGQVWRLVTAQTAIMGLIAGVLAMPVGVAMAALLVEVINRRSFGWSLDLVVPPGILLQAVVLSLIAALLAGLYPARLMAKASPAAALRGE
ncbi:MAG: FtsX-like permease family protein [Acidobacteriota bacterium]